MSRMLSSRKLAKPAGPSPLLARLDEARARIDAEVERRRHWRPKRLDGLLVDVSDLVVRMRAFEEHFPESPDEPASLVLNELVDVLELMAVKVGR